MGICDLSVNDLSSSYLGQVQVTPDSVRPNFSMPRSRSEASPEQYSSPVKRRAGMPSSPSRDPAFKRPRREEDNGDTSPSKSGEHHSDTDAGDGGDVHSVVSDSRTEAGAKKKAEREDGWRTERPRSRERVAGITLPPLTDGRDPSLSEPMVPASQSPSLPSRRRDFKQEEERRGRRILGGLLNALNQSSTSRQNKRLGLERRQQERARQRRADADERQAIHVARLQHARRIAQVSFDEQVVKRRHADLLEMARSLQTQSEPRIYYRPWQLTKEQTEVIARQTRDAEATIQRERREFSKQKLQRLRELGVQQPEPTTDGPLIGEPNSHQLTNYPTTTATPVEEGRSHITV